MQRLGNNRKQVVFFRLYGTKQKKPFEKILIANRGEIACRVMRTAQKMNIKTVAVYSEADEYSVHKQMADESICIGPAPSSESYLNVEAIVKAAKATGSQAIHPGYGFLSENANFCQRLDESGIVFIGPPVEAIHKMGDKIESKIIAKAAKVNVIPGYDGVVPNVEEAIKISKKIGYPVMIKASAGGGGKGMRVARTDADVKEFFPLASAEAKSSFGDDRLLIEKFIEEPRHIEIQILADKHGNVLWLPERDCSIQRRNQKVVEEAPSMAIDQKTREAMGKQAAALAKSVGYTSAGTVEFLFDKATGQFYFLEMNTRLQVEHPITEYITGLDLVEHMIQVAAGNPLPMAQSDIKIKGWAVEARVYAEDPKLYLPCIGKLTRYIEPDFLSEKDIRCDSGIREGSDISIYYDPMICKLSTFGKTRNEAFDRMTLALDSFVIQGVTHNVSLLREVISHPRFRDGKDVTTKFLSQEFPKGFEGHNLTEKEKKSLLVFTKYIDDELYRQGYQASSNRSLLPNDRPVWISIDGNQTFSQVSSPDLGKYFINEESINLKAPEINLFDPIIKIFVDNEPLTFQLEEKISTGYKIRFLGTLYEVTVRDNLEHDLTQYIKIKDKGALGNVVTSPMPGHVLKVFVKPDQVIKQGDDLLVVEAMKMQNLIKATRPGKIKEIKVKPGENVSANQLLIEIEDL
jgi:propionyl-CoA carboxylase alpha chain